MLRNRKSIIELARDLRKNPTPQEKRMWTMLRDRKLNGYKFLRQFPIVYEQEQYDLHFFIADFYCSEMKLVLEIDGRIHRYQKDYDEQRDLILNEPGLKVLRIKNNELNDLVRVKNKILNHLT